MTAADSDSFMVHLASRRAMVATGLRDLAGTEPRRPAPSPAFEPGTPPGGASPGGARLGGSSVRRDAARLERPWRERGQRRLVGEAVRPIGRGRRRLEGEP